MHKIEEYNYRANARETNRWLADLSVFSFLYAVLSA